MPPLERLFLLEVEFHRMLRESLSSHEATAAHTSYALQNGYESLITSTKRPTGEEVDAVKERHLMAGDLRDVLPARDSVKRLFGLPLTRS